MICASQSSGTLSLTKRTESAMGNSASQRSDHEVNVSYATIMDVA